ncbi:6-phosphogluconolactonase [Parahaliea sp. F7430]|uniref:6-phosphogluconolactonase n=1 Tax=Sediminihaliea albiluteola TaxID=2758564 RepID=A0A7W2TWZ3_9GAMM|nr:6-phosphogluconolactonase [Sediminihaliea albiluteola]MBA6413458.1 6-phosphogluconolactonase [Sediminihaliea albiluteola]
MNKLATDFSWQKFSDTAELDQALATQLAQELRRDLERRDAACLALSGGGTPKGMFHLLSQQALPWQRVSLTLVDERWVPREHADSNEAMLRSNLLQNAASDAHFIGLKTAHAQAAEGVEEAASRIAQIARPFTAVVLGMGSDGHCASWFPGAENLAQLLDPNRSELVAATQPPKAPHARMTLSLSAVLASQQIIIHITGTEKKAVLEEAISKNYPIAAVLQQRQTPVSIWWAPND